MDLVSFRKSGDSRETFYSDILLKLFQCGLEEILQRIFLFLDPRTLKNCKVTCKQWREFIDRRIWKSPSARKVLHQRLVSNWKNPNLVKNIDKILIEHRVDKIDCDSEVMEL